MEANILISTKNILNLGADYTPFDNQIVTFINAGFSNLQQLGIGPVDGFMIEDKTETWDQFGVSNKILNLVKTYIYLYARMRFDPPGTSFHVQLANEQIAEYEWRLKVMQEEELEEV